MNKQILQITDPGTIKLLFEKLLNQTIFKLLNFFIN